MGNRREDVDLELVLRDPLCARRWIHDYCSRHAEQLKFVVLENGFDDQRVIYFERMTDSEAVEAALQILNDSEIRKAVYELNLLDPDRHVH